MKYFGIYAAFVLAMMSCTSSDAETAEERKLEYAEYIDAPTTITFDNMSHDFGDAIDGDMIRHTFKFENTGENNLVLLDVKGTCGCTVPENWPKHPIEPGESGEIEVVFNSNNKVGHVKKNIRVEANTNPTVTTLTLTGKVNPKP